MNDRELLELAAKAARVELDVRSEEEFCTRTKDDVHWNPLTDDGDALRLAVKLGLTVHIFPETIFVGQCLTPFTELDIDEGTVGDAYIATRRAIVRAAAEIGKRRHGKPCTRGCEK